MGHPDWHLHEYVLEHGCGFAITAKTFPQIKKQLKEILTTSLTELQRIGTKNRALWQAADDVKVMAKATKIAVGMEETSIS